MRSEIYALVRFNCHVYSTMIVSLIGKLSFVEIWGTQRLKHCATSRKDAGSIPYGVTGSFHWHNPTVAPGLIQPLTEMSTSNISKGLKAYSA
jgi:hypothetical protein